MSAPLLTEVMPQLAHELEELLRQHEPALAAQVRHLRIVDRCRCGDESCGMFYTVTKPKSSWGAGHRNVSLNCGVGMLILDLVEDKIAAVEILDRDDVRKKLDEIYNSSA